MTNIWGARTIVLEARAQLTADAAAENHHRFQDAFDGLQWLLARTPDIGSVAEIDGIDWWVYVQSSDEIAKTPEIWVLYKITKNEVIIEHIKVTEYSEKQD